MHVTALCPGLTKTEFQKPQQHRGSGCRRCRIWRGPVSSRWPPPGCVMSHRTRRSRCQARCTRSRSRAATCCHARSPAGSAAPSPADDSARGRPRPTGSRRPVLGERLRSVVDGGEFAELGMRWRASISRTVPLRERITRLWVRMPLESMRTPRSNAPSVRPVAAKKQLSLSIRSSWPSTRSRSKPASSIAVRSSSLCGANRAWISPPIAFIAAAEMTPSGVPPMPNSTSAPASGQHVATDPYTSPSVISRIRAPLARTSPIRSAWRGPVEDDHREVADLFALCFGDPAQVLGGRRGDVDRPDGVGADGDLLHVERGAGVEHRATVGDGDHGEGVGLALRGERGAVDRVDRHVDVGRATVADVLAVVEHRGVVLLAFADDDHAVHRDGRQRQAHRLDGRIVGGVLVAAADPSRSGQTCRLGGAHQLHCEVPVGLLAR